MKITDLIKKENILVGINVENKDVLLDKLIDLMDSDNVTDKKMFKQAVLDREAESTTNIGEGICIPHGRSSCVKAAGLSLVITSNELDYDGEEPVRIAFMIASSTNDANGHLEVLSTLSRLLMNESFTKALLNAKDANEVLSIIDNAEKEKNETNETKKSTNNTYRVLAVTACPTGIAHTYMAAEGLEEAGKELGISIKVETDGSGGAKNKLTAKEIQEAEAIIVAADKNIEMARFDGKKVLMTKVADGINKPKDLINKALNSDVPVYHSDNKEEYSSQTENESVVRQIYKHLMNGVSYMLPFVVAGGILIALSFMLDSGNAGNSDFGSGTEIANFFNKIGGLSFGMMFPILAGFIAMSIADRPAFAVGVVGGLIAREGVTLGSADTWISSGFFGALIAGFAAGYVIILLKKLFNGLPKSLEGTKPVLLYPVCGILLISFIMVVIVNPPLSSLNISLNNFLNNMGSGSKILLGMILGAMMAIDFGGPLNKTAYIFGTASIATGQYEIMAAVMAGGMVPPLGIALATTFFKDSFTEKERQTTVTNYIMGLSFITEGAIPFAAADPLAVIPSCAIGSAVAGGLSMFFGCGLPAPHGGIFVVPIMTNGLMFIVSVLLGSVVTMFMLKLLKSFTKKNKNK